MATSPKFPQQQIPKQRGPQQEPPRLQVEKKTPFPWPIFAILAAILILAAIIAWMPRAPRKAMPPTAAQVPAQPTGAQLQFMDLKISRAPTGGALYLQGRVVNTGTTEVTGAQVQVTFKGTNGENLEVQVRPMEALDESGRPADLATSPMKPNQARIFRIALDRVPEGWNKQMPSLRVANVTATAPSR